MAGDEWEVRILLAVVVLGFLFLAVAGRSGWAGPVSDATLDAAMPIASPAASPVASPVASPAEPSARR